MEWIKLELRPLFDLLLDKAEDWEPENVLPRTKHLGTLIQPQLLEYQDGKYRRDRNEAVGFFEAIAKFAETGLPISLDHFGSIVKDYKNRISPYPHYSGIEIILPKELENIDKISPEEIPTELDTDEKPEDTSMKLL